MTPYELCVVLHYHTHADDYFQNGTPIVDGVARDFLRDGLIVARDTEVNNKEKFKRCYDPTPRLHAFCEMLCAVPLPVQVWVHPDWEIEKEKNKALFLYGK